MDQRFERKSIFRRHKILKQLDSSILLSKSIENFKINKVKANNFLFKTAKKQFKTKPHLNYFRDPITTNSLKAFT